MLLVRPWRALLIAVLLGLGCRSGPTAAPGGAARAVPAPPTGALGGPEGTATAGALLLRGGLVWTGDPARPRATALAIGGGRILAVGSDAEAERALRERGLSGFAVRELGGRLVLPGFIDAHVHVLGGGLSLDQVELAGARTRQETLDRIIAYARAHPERPWILGRGWSYQAWKPGLPTREELDRAVPDRPVFLRSYDGHTGWANSRALAQAGVTERTPDPPGGTIVRAKGSRRPAGALLEAAMGLVRDRVPAPTGKELEAAAERAIAHAAARGLTTLCEVGDSLEHLEIFRRLEAAGRLPLRVVYGPGIEGEGVSERGGNGADPIQAYARLRAQLGPRRADARLVPGPLKGFVDGVVESNTAALLAPYADGSGPGAPAHLDRSALVDQIRRAQTLGLDVAYHAIGDEAVRSVLDAIETVGRHGGGPGERGPAPRPRIEHLEVIDAADVGRFASLGVVASMMPAHADPGDEPEGGVWAHKLGPARLEHAFAFRSLLDAGVTLAFGSDWPVVALDPLPGIAVAATRQSANGKPAGGWIPAQRISLEEALAAYTAGSALATHLEEETGRLRSGLAADVVVLDPSVRLEDPASWFQGRVELTVAAGRVIFERPRR